MYFFLLQNQSNILCYVDANLDQPTNLPLVVYSNGFSDICFSPLYRISLCFRSVDHLGSYTQRMKEECYESTRSQLMSLSFSERHIYFFQSTLQWSVSWFTERFHSQKHSGEEPAFSSFQCHFISFRSNHQREICPLKGQHI